MNRRSFFHLLRPPPCAFRDAGQVFHGAPMLAVPLCSVRLLLGQTFVICNGIGVHFPCTADRRASVRHRLARRHARRRRGVFDSRRRSSREDLEAAGHLRFQGTPDGSARVPAFPDG